MTAGDGGRELACRCGADLLQELHAAANATREALSTHSVPDVLGGEYPCPGCGIALRRVVAAVRACEALVGELAAGRIQLVPTEVRGVAERPALASLTAERPEGDSGGIASVHGNIARDVWPNGVRLDCRVCESVRVATPEQCARYLASGWPRCCGETMRLGIADVLRAGGAAGKETA